MWRSVPYFLLTSSSSCWEVIHRSPETDPEQLRSTVKDSHIIYPVLVDKQDMASENRHLIGLVPPGSIAFIVPKGEPDSYPKKLLMAVFEAWPVLILTILLSILAGAFLWLLDTWFNEKEFPRTFFRGSWEGFWWAFVSMTTVGMFFAPRADTETVPLDPSLVGPLQWSGY